MSFEKLGLSKNIVKAVTEKGYKQPSPIQSKSIPVILRKTDVMASAQTGTGKTASFTLPILDMLHKNQISDNKVRALILVPTRELAVQINESIGFYSKYLKLRSTMVYGGARIESQKRKIRKGVDILVATPGRLLDLVQQRAVKLNSIEILVLDEADRMLDMGFINDIKKIISFLPKKRQNLLFSATFSQSIRKFAKGLLTNFTEINTASKDIIASNVVHKIHPVDKTKKVDLLIHLIVVNKWFQALVFCRTKHGANRLVQKLDDAGIKASAIHGNKSQFQRMKALDTFKKGKIQILVATNVAARGIDLHQLPQVVNIDLPNVPEDYVHRIGRTGRAGEKGEAISLVSADEINQLVDIEKVLKQRLKRELVNGFEPKHVLPEVARRGGTSKPKNSSSKRKTFNRVASKSTSSDSKRGKFKRNFSKRSRNNQQSSKERTR